MWITMNKLLGHLRRGALAGLCAALLLGSVGCGTESEESAASRKDPVSSQIVDEAYDSRIKAAQDAFLDVYKRQHKSKSILSVCPW